MAVILPSVYKDGTATVAANGVAVTGQGTMWLNTVLPGDFFGTHKGSPNRILAVNSNTSLTLAYPWLGGAQATAAYEIMYQSDNARMQESARQLLEKLSSGNVDAFAELVGAADQMPMFTGPGAMSLFSTGTKGREILAKATMLDALSALGPVFGGAMPSPAGAGVGMANGDFNNVTVTGLYTISGTWSNGPSGTGGHSGVLEVYNRGAGLCTQVYRSVNGGVYKRHTATPETATWPNAWASSENLAVGSVLNSGGYPIGAILERGSNANGDYARFADGTQICWIRQATTITTIAAGGIFRDTAAISWVFPITFLAIPALSVEMVGSSNVWAAPAVSTPSQLTSGTVFSVAAFSGSGATYQAIAVGRWF